MPETISPSADPRRKEQLVQGVLRGLPDWEFQFECRRGLEFGHLIHRGAGEHITVSLKGLGSPNPILADVICHHIKPESFWQPEGRLLRLHPGFWRMVRMATYQTVTELHDAGLLKAGQWGGIHRHEDDDPDYYRLTKAADVQTDLVTKFCERWATPEHRVWLSCLVGDWLSACELVRDSGDDDLLGVIEPRAKAVFEHQIAEAKTRAREISFSRHLALLQTVFPDRVPQFLSDRLHGDSSTACDTLDYLKHQGDSSWCPEIFRVLKQVCPKGKQPDSRLAFRCARFVAQHEFQSKAAVQTVLPLVKDGYRRDLILLTLQHAADLVPPLIRRALRSPSRSLFDIHLWAVVVLAVVDRAWSRRELVSLLEEGTDTNQQVYCVLALKNSADPEARKVAATWRSRFQTADFSRVKRFFGHEVARVQDEILNFDHEVPRG